MAPTQELSTRVTLLVRLYRSGRPDEQAWRDFVGHYGRRIYKWCRHWRLQDADAEEVTQRVLVLLLAKMKDFVYDPSRSFRAWLKTVTHHSWRDLVDGRRGAVAVGVESGQWDVLLTVAARDDLVERLEREFDRELLEQAMLRVRVRVAPHNWEAFRLTAVDGADPSEVARRLDMKIANVYAARSNVQRLLRETVAKLEEGEE